MSFHRIIELIVRYHQGILSPEEEVELLRWQQGTERREQLVRNLKDEDWIRSNLEKLDTYSGKRIWEKLSSLAPEGAIPDYGNLPEAPVREIPPASGSYSFSFRSAIRWAAAAIFIGVLSITTYRYLASHRPPAPAPAAAQVRDIAPPAANRAMITLAGGQKVYLDSVGNGALALQGTVRLVKTAAGKITYNTAGGSATGKGNAAGGSSAAALTYNTLTNPRGSQVISLTLDDGTRVWLNAASSVRYPVAFTGPDRTVEVTGEAYFEVAENAAQPFIVKKGQTEVRVLGTRFNVSAYDDEKDMRITLLEGIVKVQAEQSEAILRPGQQAAVGPDAATRQALAGPGPNMAAAGGAIKVTGDIDLDAVMAWKNGRFSFQNADLSAVMRQLSRWYDVDIEYEGVPPKRAFNGAIGKDLTLNQVLLGLTRTRVHYTIAGPHKLIIYP
jgi:transmembrane sensor